MIKKQISKGIFEFTYDETSIINIKTEKITELKNFIKVFEQVMTKNNIKFKNLVLKEKTQMIQNKSDKKKKRAPPLSVNRRKRTKIVKKSDTEESDDVSDCIFVLKEGEDIEEEKPKEIEKPKEEITKETKDNDSSFENNEIKEKNDEYVEESPITPLEYEYPKRQTRSMKKMLNSIFDKKGFINLGNTCYMNSVLHSLYASNEFFESLEKFDDEDEELIEVLLKLFNSSFEIKEKYLRKMKEIIEKKNTIFHGYRQQDAHEFLMSFIDLMNDSIPEPTLNFKGEILKTFQCTECKHKNSIIEDFYDVGLDIPLDITKNISIEDLLIQTFKQEYELERKCSKCESKKATLKLELQKLPNILILHLKRFKPYLLSGKYDYKKMKNQVHISEYIDIKLLNNTLQFGKEMKPKLNPSFKKMLKFLTDENENPKETQSKLFYSLRSFIIHIGSTCKIGHYISYVKDELKWIKCDDEILSETKQEFLKEKETESNVYILFYELNSIPN